MFEGKVLMITGGTGSFGNAVLNRFLNTGIREIRIFSRDEKKQEDMRHALNSPKLKFYIGDVRNPESIGDAIEGGPLRFSRRSVETGSLLRILSHGSRADQRHGDGQSDHGGRSGQS